MKSSGRLPSVDWSAPVIGGTESRADGFRGDPDQPGDPAERGAGDEEHDDRLDVGVVQDAADRREREHTGGDRGDAHHSRTKPMRSYIVSSVGRRRGAGLVRADAEQPMQLGLVGAELEVPLADGRQELRRPRRRRRA